MSVVKTIGASNLTKEDRQKEDYYATNPKDFERFLDALKKDRVSLSYKIWEPAAGELHLSKVLKQKGHEVFSTDLIVRCDGVVQYDFISPLFMPKVVRKMLDHPKRWNGDIITNPPFKHFAEFVELGLSRLHSGSMLMLLVPVRYLEGIARYNEIYARFPPKYIYQYVSRISIGKDGVFDSASNAVSYCWLVWEKDFAGDPRFRWIA